MDPQSARGGVGHGGPYVVGVGGLDDQVGPDRETGLETGGGRGGGHGKALRSLARWRCGESLSGKPDNGRQVWVGVFAAVPFLRFLASRTSETATTSAATSSERSTCSRPLSSVSM